MCRPCSPSSTYPRGRPRPPRPPAADWWAFPAELADHPRRNMGSLGKQPGVSSRFASICHGRVSTVSEKRHREETAMPLFMDVHTIDGGVNVDDVASAHMADLQIQSKYDV